MEDLLIRWKNEDDVAEVTKQDTRAEEGSRGGVVFVAKPHIAPSLPQPVTATTSGRPEIAIVTLEPVAFQGQLLVFVLALMACNAHEQLLAAPLASLKSSLTGKDLMMSLLGKLS